MEEMAMILLTGYLFSFLVGFILSWSLKNISDGRRIKKLKKKIEKLHEK